MACPKFDRHNKKHVIIAASVAAAIVVLIIIVVVVVILVTKCDPSGNKGGLEAHNEYRKKHHADPLTSSSDLNCKAHKCAKYYAGKGTIDHSCTDKGGAGENLYMLDGSGKSDDDEVKTAVKMWYDEVTDPGHNFNGDNSPGTGHFTQVVWKGSKELGIGIAREGSFIVVVGLYSPPGNMIGSYQANVSPA